MKFRTRFKNLFEVVSVQKVFELVLGGYVLFCLVGFQEFFPGVLHVLNSGWVVVQHFGFFQRCKNACLLFI